MFLWKHTKIIIRFNRFFNFSSGNYKTCPNLYGKYNTLITICFAALNNGSRHNKPTLLIAILMDFLFLFDDVLTMTRI